jgi:RNA-binding protein
MKRIGEVVGAAQSLAICRAPADDVPSLGTAVVDESLDEVGTVVDVFGPVERPYVAVSPDADVHLPGLVSQPLYARD